jgi:hypothetical protein
MRLTSRRKFNFSLLLISFLAFFTRSASRLQFWQAASVVRAGRRQA